MDSQKKNKSAYNLLTFQNDEDEIVEIVISGEVTKASVSDLTNEVHVIARSMDARNLLCDIREVKGRFGYSETYFQVMNIPSFFYNINTVFVDLPEHADIRTFHEYTARTTGIPFKWFTDPDDGRAWLKTQSKKYKQVR